MASRFGSLLRAAERRPLVRYAVALASAGGLLLASHELESTLQGIVFTVPIALVAVMTLALGAGPGVAATVVTATGLWGLLQQPGDTSVYSAPRELVRLGGFLAASFTVVAAIELMHRTRRRLDGERARLQAVLDSLPVAVWIADREGNIVQSNRAVERVWGKAGAAASLERYESYKGWWADTGELLKPRDWALARAVSEGDVSTGEIIDIERFDGTRGTILNNGSPVRDAQGHIIGGVAVAQDITERKQAEQAARESEGRLHSILENLSEGLMLFDAEGNLIYQNPASLRIHGFEPQHDGRIERDDLPATWNAWDEQGRPLAFDDWPVSRVFRKERFQGQVLHVERVETGHEFDASYNGSPIFDSEGNLVLGFITIREITDELRAQGALRESEERLRTLADNISQFAWITDEKGWTFWYNKRWFEYTGTTLEEMEGRGWRKVYHPDHVDRVVEKISRCYETGEPWEDTFPLRSKDGTYRWFLSRALPIRDESGKVVRWFGTNTDVTEQRAAEEALRASEAKFRSVFEQAAIGMARVSFTDARWIDVNDAFCNMLGRSREEMLGTPWPKITHADDVDLDMIPFRKMAAGELENYSVEKRFIHKQGRNIWARLTLSLVRDAEGRPDYEIAIIEDVTERKRAEEAVWKANEQLLEADRRKNEFLAVLSHELRNPLAPIRNSVYILERATPGGEQAIRARRVIDRQVQHMTRLIDDLLDVTRISRGKITLQRERVDLNALARGTAEDHRDVFARHSVELEVEGAGEPLWVDADRTRLAQVIGNLLNNSAKFTPRGGRTILSVAANAGGEAVVRVRDNGAGMSGDTLEHLFEPFVQGAQTIERTHGGLGLGLALVKGLVEMHGGKVTVHSEGEGKGAEFTVALPLAPHARAGGPRLAVLPASNRLAKARRVLVIEDNVDAAESLREALELGEHEVAVAYSGPEGMEKARSYRPDVVLCDIGLPGLDGYQVARALRADPDPALRSTYLVSLSGYALQEDVMRSKDAGFDQHMAKPPSMEMLEQAIREAPAKEAAG